MRRRVWLLAGVAMTLGFGAAEAQAGTLFKACLKSPLSTSVGECKNVFIADPGEQNAVEFRASGDRETFTEPGRVIRPPAGVRNDYFGRTEAFGQPVVHETLIGCLFTGFSASCTGEGRRSLIYLGDMDDTMRIQNGDFWEPTIYGEEGDDTVTTDRFAVLAGGPGGDTLVGPGQVRYPGEVGARPSMTIDFDGVADDGRPGENDNVRPGQWLEILLWGDHTITGHDGADRVVVSGLAGDDHVDGLGGDDDIETGPGRDTIDGGPGADNIRGEVDRDVLRGGPGSDFINGEGGDDTLHAQDGEPDFVLCGRDDDTAFVDAVDTVQDCENVIVG